MPEAQQEPTKSESRERSGTWSPGVPTRSGRRARSRTWTHDVSAKGSRSERKKASEPEIEAVRRASVYGDRGSNPLLRSVASSIGEIQFDEQFVTGTPPSSSSRSGSMKRRALCRTRSFGNEPTVPIDQIAAWEEAVGNQPRITPESSSGGSAGRHFPAGSSPATRFALMAERRSALKGTRRRRTTTSSSSTGDIPDEVEQGMGLHTGMQTSSEEDGEPSTRRRERRLTEGEGDEKAVVTTRRRSLSGSVSSGKSITTSPLRRAATVRHRTSGSFSGPTQQDLFRLSTFVSKSQPNLPAATSEEASDVKQKIRIQRHKTTYYVVTPYSEDTAAYRKRSTKFFQLFLIEERLHKGVYGLFCGMRRGEKFGQRCINAINNLHSSVDLPSSKQTLVIQIPWYQLEELLQTIDNKLIAGYDHIFVSCVRPSKFDRPGVECFGNIHVSFNPFSFGNYFVIDGLVVKQVDGQTARIFSSVLIQIPPHSCMSVDERTAMAVPAEGYALWHGNEGIFLVKKSAQAFDFFRDEKEALRKWAAVDVTNGITVLFTNPDEELVIPFSSGEVLKMSLDTDILFYRMQLYLPFKPIKPPTAEKTYVINLITGKKQETREDITYLDKEKHESLITYDCFIPSSGSDYSSTDPCISAINAELPADKVLIYIVSENREAVEWVCRDLLVKQKVKKYGQLKVLLIIRKKHPDPWSPFYRNDNGEPRENPASLSLWYTHRPSNGGIVHIRDTPCYGSAVFRYDAAQYTIKTSDDENIGLPISGKLEVTWTLTKIHVREKKKRGPLSLFKKKPVGKNVPHVKEKVFVFRSTGGFGDTSYSILCDGNTLEDLPIPLRFERKEVEIRVTDQDL